MSYVPDMTGRYTILIKYGGDEIPYSPYRIRAVPAGDASKCTVTGRCPPRCHPCGDTPTATATAGTPAHGDTRPPTRFQPITAGRGVAGGVCVGSFGGWREVGGVSPLCLTGFLASLPPPRPPPLHAPLLCPRSSLHRRPRLR